MPYLPSLRATFPSSFVFLSTYIRFLSSLFVSSASPLFPWFTLPFIFIPHLFFFFSLFWHFINSIPGYIFLLLYFFHSPSFASFIKLFPAKTYVSLHCFSERISLFDCLCNPAICYFSLFFFLHSFVPFLNSSLLSCVLHHRSLCIYFPKTL